VIDSVNSAKEFGINVTGDVSFDYPVALNRSLKVVDNQYKGLRWLFDSKHKIPVFEGRGRLLAPTKVQVTPKDGGEPFVLETKDVIINTGSRPRPIKGVP